MGLPLAFRVCLPALNNNLVNLVKTTTLAFAIAVPEMLYVSSQIWSDNVNVREMMTFLLVAYPLSVFLNVNNMLCNKLRYSIILIIVVIACVDDHDRHLLEGVGGVGVGPRRMLHN